MSAGIILAKTDWDSELGGLLRQLNSVLDQLQQVKSVLDTLADSDLTTLGYSSTDIANIRSAMTDANKLAGIYQGTQTQATVYDFRTFIKLLFGFGI